MSSKENPGAQPAEKKRGLARRLLSLLRVLCAVLAVVAPAVTNLAGLQAVSLNFKSE